jgi:hypothetical protein
MDFKEVKEQNIRKTCPILSGLMIIPRAPQSGLALPQGRQPVEVDPSILSAPCTNTTCEFYSNENKLCKFWVEYLRQQEMNEKISSIAADTAKIPVLLKEIADSLKSADINGNFTKLFQDLNELNGTIKDPNNPNASGVTR